MAMTMEKSASESSRGRTRVPSARARVHKLRSSACSSMNIIYTHLALVLLFWTINFGSTDGFKKNATVENEVERVTVEHVEGVVGFRAELPCDIFTSRREDTVYMILWFRLTDGKPLYTFDVRGRGMQTAKSWSSITGFGRRADFQPSSFPAHLAVNDLKMTDQGVYRCRVDFRNSRTRNSLVNLTVVVPPSPPIIYDESDEEVTTEIGPYLEGTSFLLKCRVKGGKPEPVVSWFINDVLVDSTYYLNGYGDVINELQFERVNRSHLNSQFTCKASNTRLIQPIEKSVMLDLLLKPLFVRLRQKRIDHVVAGTEYRVTCETAGSKPSAVLKWIKGGQEITAVNTQELDDGNVTISSLLYVPSPDDNGSSLICRAENPSSSVNYALEEVWHLNVLYQPEVHLFLGSTLNPSEIKDGTDVYFECQIKANPKIFKLAWLFNGDELRHNAGTGVIMSNQSLVLQGINRKAAGNYTCHATNSKGSTQSNAVHLSVMYAPVCMNEASTTVGVTVGENIGLRCAVKSNPTTFNFEWEFHSSGDNIDVVPIGKTVSQDNLSRFFYTPTDTSYGTFLCWGSNTVGRQIQPCVFHVVPAVKPSPLERCMILNQTKSMIHVECSNNRELPSIPDHPLSRIMHEEAAAAAAVANGQASQLSQSHNHDYGLFPEYYVMEVWDLKNRSVRRNLSAETPVFILKGLVPGSWLKLILYAVNSHGKSEPTMMETIVAGGDGEAERQAFGERLSHLDFIPFVAVGVGVAGVLLILILTIVFRSCLCEPSTSSRSRSQRLLASNCNSTNATPAMSEKISHANGMTMSPRKMKTKSITSYESVPQMDGEYEKNPDIIPGENSYAALYNNGTCHIVRNSSGDYTPEYNSGSLRLHNNLNTKSEPNEQDYEDGFPISSSRNDSVFSYPIREYVNEDYYPPLFPDPIATPENIVSPPNHQLNLPVTLSTRPDCSDFNTIYIRDKLLHDSQIPESCV